VFPSRPRPNGAAIVKRTSIGVAACIGDVHQDPDTANHRSERSHAARDRSALDIDQTRQRLYAACDDDALVELDSNVGKITNVWPTAGVPDVTFFNPSTGLVHVAIGEPGLVETINPQTGASGWAMTGQGAHTTAIVVPDQLYVISPEHAGVLVLADA
jgi:hypothetical protein